MIIIDTSVVIKWFIKKDEQSIVNAVKIQEDFINSKQQIIAPSLLLLEIANTLAYKSKLTEVKILKIWKLFISYKIPIVNLTHEIVFQSIKLAKKYDITVYDAIYVVLAKENSCDLITADKKLVEKVKLPFVKLI